MRKRKDCVLSCDVVRTLRRRMFGLIKDMMDVEDVKDEREHGMIAYQDPFSCKLKVLETCKGDRCGMVMRNVNWGNLSFHTHPTSEIGDTPVYSNIFPSVSDVLVETRQNRTFCIGGISKDGPAVRCWRPPKWRERFTDQMYRDANRTYQLGETSYPMAEKLKKYAQDFSDRSESESKHFCTMEGWRR